MKKTVSLFLTLILVTLAHITVFADVELDAAAESTAKYLAQMSEDSFNGSEWTVFGLARYGTGVPENYLETCRSKINNYIKERRGVLHDTKYTEYSKMILTLGALGVNPQEVVGYNLLMPLGDFEKTTFQGLNGSVWALIALDSGNYEIPQNAAAAVRATREKYLAHILSAQSSDGGWSMTGIGDSEVDITAMALCALSNYQDDGRVKSASDAALDFLSKAQRETGGFFRQGSENSESVSQVMIALCELGVSVDDSRFVKNGNTVCDNLLTFYDGKGGFYHVHDDSEANLMATEQAFCALAALKRLQENKTSLYDMSDVEKKNISFGMTSSDGLPNKCADVLKREVVGAKTFADISDHDRRKEIEALASREIINGKTETSFEPESTMTRAEFATIVTKGLGLSANGEKIFDDVSEDEWFFNSVSAAYQYGIVTGISDTVFLPDGEITKEEAVVMLSRAAALCGLRTEYDPAAVLDILAAFVDYVEISDWANTALAFCYDSHILSAEEIAVNPQIPVTRAEIAGMVYNMLERAELL